MKAFLLAAGLGTRLKPLTDSIPKCLVPINDRPLLHYWLDICELGGITDALINIHHHPDRVTDFLRRYKGKVRVTTSYEKELLGSGGTLLKNREFVAGDDPFLIIYADNFSTLDLRKLRDFHSRHKTLCTLAVYESKRPETGGVVELDSKGNVVSFEEKPKAPKSNLISSGIFITTNRIFDYFPEKDFIDPTTAPSPALESRDKGALRVNPEQPPTFRPESRRIDFGYDVLPRLVGNMVAYIMKEFIQDIGTLQSYAEVCKIAKTLVLG
jgi:mannose-1-phosphate guanylyltransferase